MGLAVVEQLKFDGCEVAGVARSGEVTYRADITDQVQLNELIRTVVDGFGVPDIVVHVTGGSGGIRDAMLPSSEYVKVWQLNLGAAHDINRAFLPTMAERGWGRVVHFSSNGVKLATGNSPYTSAKSAVEGYVRTMSKLYSAKGVVISAVSPGPIDTPGLFMYSQSAEWTKAFHEKYVPMGRWGKAEEVAGAVALLCSDRASYMAGTILDVDGGMR